jgi:indole-3-glycerol phosphate synthase
MESVLQEIVANKRQEVQEAQQLYPAKLLERSIYFESPTVSLRGYLDRDDLTGIIAEIKRKSPSKGMLNEHISVEKLSLGYMQAGASALSVLTDKKFFGGTTTDLTAARRLNYCPILRKDFIVDEYQIIEAKSIGADVVLLIAAVLTPQETKRFAALARSLGLEVLLEVHTEREIESHIVSEVDLVGVNNRDLATFSIAVETSERLAEKIPASMTKISESGISSPEVIRSLRQYGYKGFLIGEAFMRAASPEVVCRALVEALSR